MRFVGPAVCGGLLVWVSATGCATGTLAGGDDTLPNDSGSSPDTAQSKDSSAPKDGAVTTKDSGGGGNDATTQDTGTSNCGGQCSGVTSTCCGNTCVDTTSDPNNCNSCGFACSTGNSCCSSSCTDTMGSDNANCGGCGIPCSGTCVSGVCQQNNTCTLDLGTCAHSPCTTGVALGALCDANDEGIVDLICLFYDPSCCSSTWDATCVSWAQLFETNSCVGGGC